MAIPLIRAVVKKRAAGLLHEDLSYFFIAYFHALSSVISFRCNKSCCEEKYGIVARSVIFFHCIIPCIVCHIFSLQVDPRTWKNIQNIARILQSTS